MTIQQSTETNELWFVLDRRNKIRKMFYGKNKAQDYIDKKNKTIMKFMKTFKRK